MVIFLYNLYILGSIFESCYIQNCVIMNRCSVYTYFNTESALHCNQLHVPANCAVIDTQSHYIFCSESLILYQINKLVIFYTGNLLLMYQLNLAVVSLTFNPFTPEFLK